MKNYHNYRSWFQSFVQCTSGLASTAKVLGGVKNSLFVSSGVQESVAHQGGKSNSFIYGIKGAKARAVLS